MGTTSTSFFRQKYRNYLNVLKDHVALFNPTADLASVYERSHFSVLSSSHGEGCSNFLLESLSYGIPIVASDVGDNSFIVGDSGKIVPAKSPTLLAKAFASLFSESPKAYSERRTRAVKRSIDLFHPNRSKIAYLNLYAETLN